MKFVVVLVLCSSIVNLECAEGATDNQHEQTTLNLTQKVASYPTVSRPKTASSSSSIELKAIAESPEETQKNTNYEFEAVNLDDDFQESVREEAGNVKQKPTKSRLRQAFAAAFKSKFSPRPDRKTKPISDEKIS